MWVWGGWGWDIGCFRFIGIAASIRATRILYPMTNVGKHGVVLPNIGTCFHQSVTAKASSFYANDCLGDETAHQGSQARSTTHKCCLISLSHVCA